MARPGISNRLTGFISSQLGGDLTQDIPVDPSLRPGPLPSISRGTVALYNEDFFCAGILLGPATKVAGGPRWKELPRDRRVSSTSYEGSDPVRLRLRILFDGFAARLSVEPQIDALEQLMRRPKGGTRPPRFRIIGPVPHSNFLWVIGEQPEWGDAIRYGTTDRIIRQLVTVTVLEYVDPDQVDVYDGPGVGTKAASKGTFTVRKGERLREAIKRAKLGAVTPKLIRQVVDANPAVPGLKSTTRFDKDTRLNRP